MPQMTTKKALAIALAVLALLGFLSLAGCGDQSSGSHYDPYLGKHPDGWLPSGHAGPARQDFDSCRPCHGEDLNGGISKVACTKCHLDNPSLPVQPNNERVHGPFGYALHAGFVQQHGAAACANVYCHGANLEGATGPSCTSCHMGGPSSAHPLAWANQINLHGGFVLANGTAGCRNAVCHGPNLEGVFLSGPGCNACHNFATPIPDVPVGLSQITRSALRGLYDAGAIPRRP